MASVSSITSSSLTTDAAASTGSATMTEVWFQRHNGIDFVGGAASVEFTTSAARSGATTTSAIPSAGAIRLKDIREAARSQNHRSIGKYDSTEIILLHYEDRSSTTHSCSSHWLNPGAIYDVNVHGGQYDQPIIFRIVPEMDGTPCSPAKCKRFLATAPEVKSLAITPTTTAKPITSRKPPPAQATPPPQPKPQDAKQQLAATRALPSPQPEPPATKQPAVAAPKPQVSKSKQVVAKQTVAAAPPKPQISKKPKQPVVTASPKQQVSKPKQPAVTAPPMPQVSKPKQPSVTQPVLAAPPKPQVSKPKPPMPPPLKAPIHQLMLRNASSAPETTPSPPPPHHTSQNPHRPPGGNCEKSANTISRSETTDKSNSVSIPVSSSYHYPPSPYGYVAFPPYTAGYYPIPMQPLSMYGSAAPQPNSAPSDVNTPLGRSSKSQSAEKAPMEPTTNKRNTLAKKDDAAPPKKKTKTAIKVKGTIKSRQQAADSIHRLNAASGQKNDKAAVLAAEISRGVTLRPSGKWQAQMFFAGKSRYIGVFDQREKACLAYEIAREKLRGKLCNGDAANNLVNLARKAAFDGVNEPLKTCSKETVDFCDLT